MNIQTEILVKESHNILKKEEIERWQTAIKNLEKFLENGKKNEGEK